MAAGIMAGVRIVITAGAASAAKAGRNCVENKIRNKTLDAGKRLFLFF
jgi:hypothetical protein